ncbi:phospholipase-like protein, partial [Tanacetum coccineum]
HEFFEVLATSFEKQSSAAGGYRGKMTNVLKIFRKARLPVMMLDVHVEGLVDRLFKQFLTSADSFVVSVKLLSSTEFSDLFSSNTSATLLEMERIMTMIIDESKELALDLEALIIATLDKIDSPLCWQLGEKVLLNCAAKLQPRFPNMEAKETIPSTSRTSNTRNNTTHKIKVECIEESVDTVQTLRHYEIATTDRVNLPGHHAEEGKKKVSSDDPPMPSKCVTEVKGKRKRNNKQVLPFASGNYSSMAVSSGSGPAREAKETIPSTSETSNLRNDTTHKIKVECPEENKDTVQTPRNHEHATTDGVNHLGLHTEDVKKKVSSDDPPMPSKSVIEVTGKRKRNNEQFIKYLMFKNDLVLPCLPKSAYSWTREDGKKKVSSDDPAMPSKSVTEMKGKRKRNNKHVLPFASGNYSSMAVARGLVLPCLPKSAYSWTREDGKKKVSSDDPAMPSKSVTEVTGNNKQGVPRKVFYSMTHVQGYKVKKIHAPILEAIFKKHGDIATDCVVKTASVRESILEVVCEVVKRIQTNDVATIVSDMKEIEMQVLDAEATNMKVAWLRAHLEAIHKRNAAQKKSTSIVKMKANTSLVKRAAKLDLEERRIELLTAQERFNKAEKCVKVLDLVEMKLNDNFVESEAEEDLGPEQPIL